MTQKTFAGQALTPSPVSDSKTGGNIMWDFTKPKHRFIPRSLDLFVRRILLQVLIMQFNWRLRTRSRIRGIDVIRALSLAEYLEDQNNGREGR